MNSEKDKETKPLPPVEGDINEGELEEVTFDSKKKPQRKPKPPAQAAEATKELNEKLEEAPKRVDVDYEYKELLDRIFNLLNKSDQGTGGQGTKTKFPLPMLGRIGTKRTGISNFKEICLRCHRPPEHVSSFIQVELGANGSLDANQQLIIKGRFQQTHIEKVIKNYLREYVICKVCKSYDTVMEKENRLNFVKCSQCNSRLSVAHIQKGFQAIVGKRKQTT